jgi:hypothetical protein
MHVLPCDLLSHNRAQGPALLASVQANDDLSEMRAALHMFHRLARLRKWKDLVNHRAKKVPFDNAVHSFKSFPRAYVDSLHTEALGGHGA